MLHRALRQEPDAVTPALAAALGPWLHEAGNPFVDWYFGAPEIAATLTAAWAARPSSELYLGRALLAEEPGGARPVGCLIGLGGAELSRCRAADFAAFCQELGPGPEAEATIAQVVAVSRTLFPRVGEDELYISRVAIDPHRRGRGLGRALVAHAIDHYRAQGFRRFRLDVSADNVAAIRAYEAIGLRVLSVARSEEADLSYCAMVLQR